MGALDEYGECIAAAAAEQGWDWDICSGDGLYLYRVFNKETGAVFTLTPGEFAKVLGIEWEWWGGRVASG